MSDWYKSKYDALFANYLEANTLYFRRVALEEAKGRTKTIQNKLTKRIRQLHNERDKILVLSDDEAEFIMDRFRLTGYLYLSSKRMKSWLRVETVEVMLKPSNFFKNKSTHVVNRKLEAVGLSARWNWGYPWVYKIELSLKEFDWWTIDIATRDLARAQAKNSVL